MHSVCKIIECIHRTASIHARTDSTLMPWDVNSANLTMRKQHFPWRFHDVRWLLRTQWEKTHFIWIAFFHTQNDAENTAAEGIRKDHIDPWKLPNSGCQIGRDTVQPGWPRQGNRNGPSDTRMRAHSNSGNFVEASTGNYKQMCILWTVFGLWCYR